MKTPESQKQASKRYYEKNKKKLIEYSAQYKRNNNEKTRENQREYNKTWYSKNKELKIQQIKERQQKLREWLREYKENLSCEICGENHISCIQFHHKDMVTKEMSIADAITRKWGIERILKEIEKCQVVCANCHFKIHYQD
jgi:hypothetical protein